MSDILIYIFNVIVGPQGYPGADGKPGTFILIYFNVKKKSV